MEEWQNAVFRKNKMSIYVSKLVFTLDREHIVDNKSIDKFSEPLMNAVKYVIIKPKRQEFRLFKDNSNKVTVGSHNLQHCQKL